MYNGAMLRWFKSWYEEFFPPEELSPRTFVRRVVREMEEYGQESLEGTFLVPNRIVLKVGVGSEEERAQVRAFFDEAEVISVLTSELEKRGYQTRGPLDFRREETDLRSSKPFEIVLGWPTSGTDEVAERPTQQQKMGDAPTPAENGTLFLVVTHPELPRRELHLRSTPARIGRKPENHICLTQTDVSRYHADVQLIRGVAHVTDRQSTNGTYINGEQIPPNVPHSLVPGDRLGVGKTVTLILEDRDPERTRM
jgi:pSer/pThr/pTyr-binding forkhead associated (FHA) protein